MSANEAHDPRCLAGDPHVPNACFGERDMHHGLDGVRCTPLAAGLFGIASPDAFSCPSPHRPNRGPAFTPRA